MSWPSLLTRPGCGLCEEFLADWQSAFPGIDLPRRNVDDDAALRSRFGDTIPVLLDETGAEVCRVHFDRAACAPLVARLRSPG